MNHVNPVTLLRTLALGGIYVETVFIAWICLACRSSSPSSEASPTRCARTRGRGDEARPEAKSEKQFDAVVSSLKEAVDDVVKEQEPYERFNGRLAMVGFARVRRGRRLGGLGPLTS